MKSLLKFTLLSALIISGKLVKQYNPATPNVQAVEAKNYQNPSIVLVHQSLTSEPVQPTQEQAQPQQSGSGLLAEMF